MLQIIALSSQLGTNKTLAVNVYDQAIVLFRDKDGKVVALEDRCPHRRVPLSLGKVIQGELRCAYHGWTFNGNTGACTNIPNLSAKESVPAKLKAKAFIVQERNGFIYWQRSDSVHVALPPAIFSQAIYLAQNEGIANLTLSMEAYRSVLFDGPEMLISLYGIGITDYFLGDVIETEYSITIDRAADWQLTGRKPSWKSPDYPLIIRSEIFKHTTCAKISLLNSTEQVLIEVYLSVVPDKRSTSRVLWQARSYQAYFDSAPLLNKLKCSWRKNLVKVHEILNANSINKLMLGPSARLQSINVQ